MAAPVTNADAFLKAVESRGFARVPTRIEPERVHQLCHAIEALPQATAVRRRTGVYGIRNLLSLSPAVRELAVSDTLRQSVTAVLGPSCFAVRALYFDKTPDANWSLRWHQDSVIAVRERIETPGFTGWATKAGVLHVRPPLEVLRGMLAVRVHLDESHATNGPLRVLAGSHLARWEGAGVHKAKAQFQETVCCVPRGGMLAMRPLTLHASAAAETPDPRRVIHLEFAAAELPNGLEWHERVG